MTKVLPEVRNKIKDALNDRRQMTVSTCRTYTSLLSNLYTKLEADSMKFFTDDSKKIIAHIEGLESDQTKKTIYSALVVLVGNNVMEYNSLMREAMGRVQTNYRKQTIDTDRVDKWMSFEDVKKIHDILMETAKMNPTIENINNAVLSGIMSGYYPECPPRRLTDYSEMKSSNFDKKEDNYVLGNTMYFNVYKTAKHEKAKGIFPSLVIPKALRPMITKLKKVSGDYLFVNIQCKKFTPSSLNKRLNSLFGFGVDMLRSIYLSDIYKDTPKLDQAEKLAEQMSHSTAASLYYVKK